MIYLKTKRLIIRDPKPTDLYYSNMYNEEVRNINTLSI